MSRRSGNRWDDRDRQPHRGHYNDYRNRNGYRPRPPPPTQQRSVSDEDTLKALLGSAQDRAREREGEGKKNQYRRNGRDGERNNRGRWGDKGSGKDNNKASYYGPSETSNGDDNHDRKRKRFSDRDREGNESSSRRRWGESKAPNVVEDDRPNENKASQEEEQKPPPEFKPNFGLSGALAKDKETGNVYKGVVLKFKEPPEARAPNTQWRFYVFKPKKANNPKTKKSQDDNELVETLHISKQSAYLLGRNGEIADIPLLHPSLSSQHAVLQYRAVPVKSEKIGEPPRLSCQPYIMDLESTNGTFLNGIRIDAARYYQLRRGDVLTFGASTREYVLLTENTTSVN